MAEQNDFEKTEPASQRRLEDAREEGDVPRSREVETCLILLAAAGGLWFLGETLLGDLNRLLASGLTFDRTHAFESAVLLNQIAADIGGVLFAFAPLALLLVGAALVAPLLIGGWLFNTKSIKLDISRLSPLRGLRNMLSVRAGMELTKAVGKALLVGMIAVIVVWHQKEAALTLASEPLRVSAAHLGELLLRGFAATTAALSVIALADAPFQLWQYARKLRMTREEMRQETKETEGNPQLKARIRAQQREVARRRMMSEVPKADVVVTNPTHFAVALKYADGEMSAPKVVAKGVDQVAARIREIATENNVPLLAAPPLARALYRHTDIGDEIPEALYTAVAEVLAYVFQLRAYRRSGGTNPLAPNSLMVPPHLDPQKSLSIEHADRGLA
jgi:flagellar biosynthesis protein FlhB